MEMKYRLPGSLPIILNKIKACTAQRTLHRTSYLCPERKHLGSGLFVQSTYIRKMLLRQDQGMSP